MKEEDGGGCTGKEAGGSQGKWGLGLGSGPGFAPSRPHRPKRQIQRETEAQSR